MFYQEELLEKGMLLKKSLDVFVENFLSWSKFTAIYSWYRIIRAFLVEEQKIVKKVLKIQKAKEKQASKS